MKKIDHTFFSCMLFYVKVFFIYCTFTVAQVVECGCVEKVKSSMARSLPVVNQNVGFNYQLLAVITEVAEWGTPSCSQPQQATDNDVRDARSNLLVAPPTLMGSTP